ncbi:MAG TPA: diguanylate cyclase, partial [Steroidobacteraceae bacterium]|nr:diguanylate cyclase [Steroidobacteraceae bacterium]
MRSHGLKSRLLFIALLAGIAISATLFVLEYVDYRQTRDAVGTQGERSLLAAETKRLDSAASDLAAATAPSLENALRARDDDTVSRIATALLENHATVAVRVLRPDGTLLFETRRSNAWASSLTPEEQRTVRRDLGDLQVLGTLELTVARPGLRSSATALRSQLQQVEQRDFARKAWIISAAGTLITLMLGVVAWLLAQRLERPIVELIRSAERIGEGDYTRPHQVTSNDEIADLEVALDRMRQKLQQTTITKNYLTTVLNSMNDAVLVTAPNGMIKRINDAAVRLFGYSEEELAGRQFTTLLADNERASFSMEAAGMETRETVIATRSGQTIPVSLSGAPIAAEDPQFQGTIFVVRNITDRKRAERRIRYLARYDALTKVPNRMQFQHMLQQAIARARRNDRGIVLLYLDMDRFKEINDTFGHAAGDRTLEVLSERLTHILP